jgi:hypothetical protein
LHEPSASLDWLYPEICALLGYYAALIFSSLPTFRDNLSVPYSMVKKSKKLYFPSSKVKKSNFFDILTLEDVTDRLSGKVFKRQEVQFLGLDP